MSEKRPWRFSSTKLPGRRASDERSVRATMAAGSAVARTPRACSMSVKACLTRLSWVPTRRTYRRRRRAACFRAPRLPPEPGRPRLSGAPTALAGALATGTGALQGAARRRRPAPSSDEDLADRARLEAERHLVALGEAKFGAAISRLPPARRRSRTASLAWLRSGPGPRRARMERAPVGTTTTRLAGHPARFVLEAAHEYLRVGRQPTQPRRAVRSSRSTVGAARTRPAGAPPERRTKS